MGRTVLSIIVIIMIVTAAVVVVESFSVGSNVNSTTSSAVASSATASAVASSTSATSTSSGGPSASSTSSVTLVSGQTTSAASTGVATYPSIFLKSTGEGSPSYNTTSGEYGESIALDGPFLIVGAPNETSDGYVGAGNAYVYNSTSGALLESLTSPSPQKLGNFGWFVAGSGDLAIIGAPGESSSGVANAGQVYIFNVMTGKLLDTLTSPNAQPRGAFGGDVSASGSLLVIGAAGENTTFGLAGRTYVYNTTTGSLIGTLQSPNAEYEGEFGSTVYATSQYVVVGAQNETVDGNEGAGRVYVYNATDLLLVKTLVSPNPQANGEFGFSLTTTSSVLVVGAPFEGVAGAPGVGNVYIFSLSSWSLVQSLSGPTEQQTEDPNFGFQVAAGYGYLAVSAPYNDTVVSAGDIRGGAVYLYNETTFAPIAGLTAPSESGEFYSLTFGYAIALGPGSLSVGDPSAVELTSSSPGYSYPGDAFVFELT